MKTMLFLAALLVAPVTASAGEVLYYLDGGQWRAAGGYQDPAECGRAAKALAEKLKTSAGCAAPSAAIQYDPNTARTNDWESAAASCAKKSGVQITTDGRGSGKTFGSDKQHFAFDKCMNERNK